MSQRYGRFVDARVIKQRMDRKDARLQREAKAKADAPHCPRCGSYAWIYKGGNQVCADCGKE